MQALNAVMMIFQTALRPLGPEALVELQQGLGRLVDCVFPIEGNTVDLAGDAPLSSGHYVHPIKTAEAAVLLGRATGMPRSRLITLATAAALMNVGYLQLKQSLIDEPRNLIDAEWETQMHAHPAHSVATLTASGLPHEAVVAIGQHHERWDGSGYPHGARGRDICIEAQILGIADTFVALRSSRPHRPALPAEEALPVIGAGGGTLFEPHFASTFLDVIRTYAPPPERTHSGTTARAAQTEEPASVATREDMAPPALEAVVPVARDADAISKDATTPPASRREGAQAPLSPAPASTPCGPVVRRPVEPPKRSMSPTAQKTSARNARRAAATRTPWRRRNLFSTTIYLAGVRDRRS